MGVCWCFLPGKQIDSAVVHVVYPWSSGGHVRYHSDFITKFGIHLKIQDLLNEVWQYVFDDLISLGIANSIGGIKNY